MIDFTQETYASLRQEMLDRVPDTYDKRDTAPIPTAISPAAYTLAGFYLTLDRVQRAAFVQTAVGDSLDMLAVIGGLTRYPASAAVRLGVFNTSVPIGARFSTINGAGSINFTVTAATDTGNQYQLTAETPGAIGNEYTGPILPITAIPGLTSAQITDILVPGDDTETDSAFRERLIEALNNRPFGGNIADYRQNVLAIDGVGGVQVYPTWSGGGTVKLSVLGADFLPASSTLVEKVQNAIDPPPNQGLGLGAGHAIGQVQEPVEQAIETYLRSVRQGWDANVSSNNVSYAADVYVARVTAAIVGVAGVVNATNVQLNGGTADLLLTETGETQQVPVIGTVTLNESN